MDILPIINQLPGSLWFLISIGIVAAILKSSLKSSSKSSRFKGVMGEFGVNLTAKMMLDKNKYRLIKNVTLPTEDGSTQIDHIIVSIYGIFVVETKNMAGWIFGSPRQRVWTQRTYKHSSKFQNPLHQNHKHVKTLEALLGLNEQQIYSVVVFVGGSTFKTKMPENVTHGGGYIRFIKSKKQQIFSEIEVVEITKRIESGRLAPSFETDREHAKHVRNIVNESSEHQD